MLGRRYRSVLECPASRTRYKKEEGKKKDFLYIFKYFEIFLYFFFFRTCAERAQEHTRTHTGLTAGVEGRKQPGS